MRNHHHISRTRATAALAEHNAMARAAWTLGLGLALALFAGVPARAGTPVTPSPERVREALRGHTLRTLDGKSFTLSSLGDAVVVVNFWASWCKPCRRELPALDDLHAELAPQGGQVVAISIDEDPANVRRFVRDHALGLPVCIDGPSGLARELDLGQVPFTVILDRDGHVAFTGSGGDRQALREIGAVTRRLLAADRALTEGGER